MIGKYLVLTGSPSGYFVTDILLDTETLLDILPNMYRGKLTEIITEEARLVPREIFIKEKELWHRVMDTIWYPNWEEWKIKVQKWFPDKQINFYKVSIEENSVQTYISEFEYEGWFVNLTDDELKDIQDTYRTEIHLSDNYKQNDEFLTVLVIKR